MTRTRYMVRAVIKPGYAALTSFERGTADRSGLESALRELAGTFLISGAMPGAAVAPIRKVHDFLLASDAFEEIEWGPAGPPEPDGRPHQPPLPEPGPEDPLVGRRLLLVGNAWERTALARRLLVRSESLGRGHFTTVTLTDGDAERYGLEPKMRLWFGRSEFGIDAVAASGAEVSSALPYVGAAERTMMRRNVRTSAVRALAKAFSEIERG